MSTRRLPRPLPGTIGAVAVLLAVHAALAAPQSPSAGRHNVRMAANAAEKFVWSLALSPAFSYELLAPGARTRMPPPDFLAALSRIFPDGPPGSLQATHFVDATETAVDILLTGSGAGVVRLRMAGSAAQGYRVLEFARLAGAPEPSARRVAPDTGPFRRLYPMAADAHVAFVPVAADVSVVSGLADVFGSRLRLTTTVQAPYVPSPQARSLERGQLIGEILARELQPRCRRVTSGTPFVIGVTGEDMHLQTYPRWRFAFSYRVPPCVAVVSYARMQIDASPDLRAARLRKMVAKNLGVLVYGLPLSKDPRSLMFDEILGVEDLDFADDSFDRAGMAPGDRK